MKFPFESKEAATLNKEIFETIYFASLTASCDLAKKHGPYESYQGSLVQRGFLQFDMWNVTPSKRWDWDKLRKEIKEHGLRNSLLIAPMPTASTAQILGNNECFEPYTSNIYTRRVLSGEFPVVNKYLLNNLIELDLWNPEMRNEILRNNGSIQSIESIPDNIKNLFKTVWEIPQRVLIDMAADRGAFIDQSQSLNLFIAAPTYKKLTSMHFYAWRKGLKTGLYYLRTKPASETIKFTLNANNNSNVQKKQSETKETPQEPYECLSCGA